MADQKPAKDSSAVDPLPPLDRKSVESGLIPRNTVSEARRPQTSVTESVNFYFDSIGAAVLRPGTTALGNSLGYPIQGMTYFVNGFNVGVYTQMIIAANENVYYLSGSTWTQIFTGLGTLGQVRFTTFLTNVFMVDGVDSTMVWDGNPSGSGFVTSGNASGAPVGAFIEVYRSVVWIAGNPTYPDRLYWSTIPSADTTQTITWSADPTTGVQWSDIDPNNGDTITGLQRYRNKLLVFKTNHIYRVYAPAQNDVDPWYSVGTTSQESIVETKSGIYFFHSSGFYLYNVYDVVQEVSGPIRIDIIKNIPASTWPHVVGWVEPDGDHVTWSVGTVTILGVTYTNLHLRYTISTMVWTHMSYPTQPMASVKRQPLYTDGTKQYALVGDNAGNILKINIGLQDTNATGQLVPIYYSLIHPWENMDGTLATRKTIMTVNFNHYGGAGATVAYQTELQDPDDLGNWQQKVGQPSQLKTINTGFNSANIKARKFRFRIFGQSTGVPFSYNGYEIIDGLSEFIQFEN
jgi:hypothetical protein